MLDRYRDHLAVAEEAARRAGDLLASLQGRVVAREKNPGDLVTEADSASQALIWSILSAKFPGQTLLAEEDGAEPDLANPWRWIVDPLDGTINFAHGFPFWCISIALEHEGELAIGVIHDPIQGRTFRAMKGGGSELNGRPIRVSAAPSLGKSLIAAAFPTAFAADSPRQLALLDRLSTGTHSVRRTGSSALNLAWLAAGAVDLFYATKIHPWDVAAGVLIVREAGGKVTGLDGLPYDLYRPEIVASNGRIHAEAIEAIRSAWPAR